MPTRCTSPGASWIRRSITAFPAIPGGLKEITLRDQIDQHPDRVIQAAVKGMLPHNRLGRQLIKKLKVYAGPEHPHQAQQPKPFPAL